MGNCNHKRMRFKKFGDVVRGRCPCGLMRLEGARDSEHAAALHKQKVSVANRGRQPVNMLNARNHDDKQGKG